MLFLYFLQPFDLSLIKFLFLKRHIRYLSFAPIHRILQYIIHLFERLRHVIMDPFQYRCDIAIEMVKVGDQFDKAQINQGIPASNDTGVDFFLDC